MNQIKQPTNNSLGHVKLAHLTPTMDQTNQLSHSPPSVNASSYPPQLTSPLGHIPTTTRAIEHLPKPHSKQQHQVSSNPTPNNKATPDLTQLQLNSTCTSKEVVTQPQLKTNSNFKRPEDPTALQPSPKRDSPNVYASPPNPKMNPNEAANQNATHTSLSRTDSTQDPFQQDLPHQGGIHNAGMVLPPTKIPHSPAHHRPVPITTLLTHECYIPPPHSHLPPTLTTLHQHPLLPSFSPPNPLPLHNPNSHVNTALPSTYPWPPSPWHPLPTPNTHTNNPYHIQQLSPYPPRILITAHPARFPEHDISPTYPTQLAHHHMEYPHTRTPYIHPLP
jgi:hypothetical protein